jgi:hypothetical protein
MAMAAPGALFVPRDFSAASSYRRRRCVNCTEVLSAAYAGMRENKVRLAAMKNDTEYIGKGEIRMNG